MQNVLLGHQGLSRHCASQVRNKEHLGSHRCIVQGKLCRESSRRQHKVSSNRSDGKITA